MISKFNETITVQKNTVTSDIYGNRIPIWTDHFTCKACADTYTKEEDENIVPTDERSISFEVRYCSELSGITSTEYRIQFRGQVFNIESVDMMNWRKRTIRLKCRKEKRQ